MHPLRTDQYPPHHNPAMSSSAVPSVWLILSPSLKRFDPINIIYMFHLSKPLECNFHNCKANWFHPTVLGAFRLSNNNKWRWWTWMVAAYQQTQLKSVDFALGLEATWRSVCLHHNEPSELLQWFCHDDSTINTVTGIIIAGGSVL